MTLVFDEAASAPPGTFGANRGHCRGRGAALRATLWIDDDAGTLSERCVLQPARDGVGETPAAALAGALAEALAAALDLRERESGLHSKRFACHTLVLARRAIGDSGPLNQIYWGALLHDIGKIGIPDAILLKPGALTAAERRVMQAHPENGYRIVAAVPGIEEGADLVRSHEGRFDGTGYPRALAGGLIPFGARLFAVIDTLDAMTTDRPYRRARSFDSARAEIVGTAGTQLDPVAVDAFPAEEATLRRMVQLKCSAQPPPFPEHHLEGEPRHE